MRATPLKWADSSQETPERYSSFTKTATMGLMAALALAALAAEASTFREPCSQVRAAKPTAWTR